MPRRTTPRCTRRCCRRDADLVITNYGHNRSTSATKSGSSTLLDFTHERWGDPAAVVTVQDPATGDQTEKSAANQGVVRAVAADRSLQVIDVNKAFTDAGELADLLADYAHPNPAGSRV